MQNENEGKLKFIDLFAGVGGFRLALERANAECVFSSEWNKSARDTYLLNHGDEPLGDIRETKSRVPAHDILAAGFPCQPFSGAGVSARNSRGLPSGFKCKTQGTLFFEIMDIAETQRPAVLFLENVKNITTHDKGETFKTIKGSIDELGYDFAYAVIDSSGMVPQKRLRCYMVCFRKDLNIDFKFPEFPTEEIPLKSILESSVDEKYTISDKAWAGHKRRTKNNLSRGAGFTAFEADINKPSKTLVARYGKDGKECLIPQPGNNPRMLTVRECARLQGFPESFKLPESRAAGYRQFGNSIALPVVTKIAVAIAVAMVGKRRGT